MRVVVIGDRTFTAFYIALQAMYRQVHLSQASSDTVFLVSVKGELMRIKRMALHKVSALYEHAARAASRVKNFAVIRLQHIHNQLHQRHRGEKFTAIVRALISKLGEKVFVNATKDIACGLL